MAVAESDDEQWVPCQWLKRMTSPIIKQAHLKSTAGTITFGSDARIVGICRELTVNRPLRTEKDLLFCSNGNVPESGKMIQCYWDFVHPTVPTI